MPTPEEKRALIEQYLGATPKVSTPSPVPQMTPEEYQDNLMQEQLLKAGSIAYGNEPGEGAAMLRGEREASVKATLEQRKAEEARAAKVQGIKDKLAQKSIENELFPKASTVASKESYNTYGEGPNGELVPLVFKGEKYYQYKDGELQQWVGPITSKEETKGERQKKTLGGAQVKIPKSLAKKYPDLHDYGFTETTKNYNSYKTDAKKLVAGLSSVNVMRDMLDADNPLDYAAIKAQMPRLMGEVGNLSESEQRIWTAHPDLLNMARSTLQKYFSVGGDGTWERKPNSSNITTADRKALTQIVNIAEAAKYSMLDKLRAERAHQSIQMAGTENTQFVEDFFKPFPRKPRLPEEDEKQLSPETEAKIQRVMEKRGISREAVIKALKAKGVIK